MKASELLRDQVKVIRNVLPDAINTIRETVTMCENSNIPQFVEMGRELSSKETTFAALGGLQMYFDMMDLLVKITAAAEDHSEAQGRS